MSVYCVFEAYADEEGYSHFSLKGVGKTLEDCLVLIENYASIRRPVHPSMTRENNYTYIGTRDECTDGTGGYVIEEILLTSVAQKLQ